MGALTNSELQNPFLLYQTTSWRVCVQEREAGDAVDTPAAAQADMAAIQAEIVRARSGARRNASETRAGGEGRTTTSVMPGVGAGGPAGPHAPDLTPLASNESSRGVTLGTNTKESAVASNESSRGVTLGTKESAVAGEVEAVQSPMLTLGEDAIERLAQSYYGGVQNEARDVRRRGAEAVAALRRSEGEVAGLVGELLAPMADA